METEGTPQPEAQPPQELPAIVEAPATIPGNTSPPSSQKTMMERKEILARQIQMSVASGRRVESQSDTNAVFVKGKDVNHVLHVILSVLSCGLWLPVWLILIVTGGEKREMVTVDEWGNAAVQRV